MSIYELRVDLVGVYKCLRVYNMKLTKQWLKVGAKVRYSAL